MSPDSMASATAVKVLARISLSLMEGLEETEEESALRVDFEMGLAVVLSDEVVEAKFPLGGAS